MTAPSRNTNHRRRRKPKLGPIISEMRREKGLTRPEVLRNYYQEAELLKLQGDDYETRGEAWLARVEQSDNTISTVELELLMRAMDCNLLDRTRVMVQGERTPFIIRAEQRHVTAYLTFIFYMLCCDVRVTSMIATMVDDQKVFTLSEKEAMEIFLEIAAVLRKNSR